VLLFSAALVSSVAAITTLWIRRYRLARLLAIAQVTLIVGGWGAAQYPYLLSDALDITAASSPPHVQSLIACTLAIGILPLGGCIYYLMRVFKRSTGVEAP
jgi:cytochrome d ubiquinol oxidase subunit II